MQTVGAQQLMLTLTTSAALVALIQTAAALPIALLAVLAGAIGDLVDRRRLLIAAQSFMLVAALALAGLAVAGLVTPLLLLALIFAVGSGQTLTSPTWQTLQPELVASDDRTQAIALGAVNVNLSRSPLRREQPGAARHPAARWAVHALRQLALGTPASDRGRAAAPGCRGLRAAARRRGGWSGRRRAGTAAAACSCERRRRDHRQHARFRGPSAGTRLPPRPPLAGLALVIGGGAWILVLSTLNSHDQSTLPGWATARGMSYYLVIFKGGGALGAAAFGVIAQHAGLTAALLAAAAGLAGVAVAGVWLPFRAISPQDLLPAGDWPDPQLVGTTAADGPVQVTVEYRPRPGLERELVRALYAGRRARRRTGAVSWRVWRDAADPSRVLEQFVVGSWTQHLRQHERVSRRDQQRLDAIRAMTDPRQPPTVTHWLAPKIDRDARGPSPSR